MAENKSKSKEVKTQDPPEARQTPEEATTERIAETPVIQDVPEKKANERKSERESPSPWRSIIAAGLSIVVVCIASLLVAGIFKLTSDTWTPPPVPVPESKPAQALSQNMNSEKISRQILGVPPQLVNETKFKTGAADQ